MEAMVNHGKEKIISLDWFEKKIKLKEKNLEAKSMGHVEIIADHYIFFFSLQNSSESHANLISSKCAKAISAKNCTSGSSSQLLMLLY